MQPYNKRLDFFNSLIVLFLVSMLGFNFAFASEDGAGESTLKLAAAESSAKKPKHVIFFVHGLIGTEGTFAEFKKVINKEFGSKVLVGNLTYPTVPVNCNLEQNDYVQPYGFAKVINSKIIHFYWENGLDIQTPYTILAHSQGGLVSMIYLNSCMKVHKETKEPWCKYEDGAREYQKIVTPERTESFKSEEFQEVLNDYIAENQDEFDGLSSAGKKRFKREKFYKEYPGCAEFATHAQKLIDNRNAKKNYLKVTGEDGKVTRLPSVPNIENFITLGSPLWGSATANRGQTIRAILEMSDFVVDIDKLAPLEQLMRLAIGSRGTSWQRNFMLNRNSTPEHKWTEDTQWQSPYPKGMKVYSTSGDLCEAYDLGSQWNNYETAFRPLIRACSFESDVIVGASEARPDFIYSVENVDPSKPSLKGRTKLAKAYYGTKIPHIPFLDIPGMTSVDLENYESHSSFIIAKKVLENSLNGVNDDADIFTEEERDEHFNEDYENFMSEIKFVTPKGYHRKFQIMPEQVTITPDMPKSFENVRIGNWLYAMGDAPNFKAVKMLHNYYQTFYHIGKVAEGLQFDSKLQYKLEDSIMEDAEKRFNLNYEVNLHGFETRNESFENYVAPSYTSYTEVRVNPYLPISNNQTNNKDDETNSIVGINQVIDPDQLGQRRARILKMGQDGRLMVEEKSYNSLTPLEYALLEAQGNGHAGRCYVGTMGLQTPKYFRHQVLDEVPIYVDGLPSGKKEIRPKMRPISSNAWTTKISDTGHVTIAKQYEGLTGEELWNKYASNKNWAFKNFSDEGVERVDMIIEPGETVEILGRYSVGHVDKFSDVGRDCHHDEIEAANEGKTYVSALCATQGMKGNIDRYLVTSPSIRMKDGVSEVIEMVIDNYVEKKTKFEQRNGFDLVGAKGPNGSDVPQGQWLKNIPGTRWVNVRDVDVFKDEYPVYRRSSGGLLGAAYSIEYQDQGTCLTKDGYLENSYLPVSRTLNEYYKIEIGLIDMIY